MNWRGLELSRITEARNEPLMNLSTALKNKSVILLDGVEYEHIEAVADLLKRDGQ